MPSDDNNGFDRASWPEASAYFETFAEGRFDKAVETGFIYSVDNARISADGERLYIGRAGSSGIEFVYRPGSPAIWAYYPIDGDYDLKSEDIFSFEADWRAGKITV